MGGRERGREEGGRRKEVEGEGEGEGEGEKRGRKRISGNGLAACKQLRATVLRVLRLT